MYDALKSTKKCQEQLHGEGDIHDNLASKGQMTHSKKKVK